MEQIVNHQRLAHKFTWYDCYIKCYLILLLRCSFQKPVLCCLFSSKRNPGKMPATRKNQSEMAAMMKNQGDMKLSVSWCTVTLKLEKKELGIS